MLSVMSAHKILRPDVIYFHTNLPPTGPYWQRVLKLPKLKVWFKIRVECHSKIKLNKVAPTVILL